MDAHVEYLRRLKAFRLAHTYHDYVTHTMTRGNPSTGGDFYEPPRVLARGSRVGMPSEE